MPLRRFGSALALLVVVLLPNARPLTAELRADQFTAQLTLTTDYVFRGRSQSREDPAIQGGVQYRADNGFFAGVWASSVDFASNRIRSEPRDLELDIYLGYGLDLGAQWAGTVQLTRYTYPGDDPAFEYNYDELTLAVQFRDRVGLAANVSNDLFDLGERAVAWEISGRQPLSDRIDGVAGYGHFDLDSVVGSSYDYWNLGASLSIRQFVIEVAYIASSTEAEAIFGREATGRRWVASLSAYLD